MSDEMFVPGDFAVPDGLIAGEFRLAPLGPQHNEADYAAWTASIDHIRGTPGFPDGSWPREMSLNDNLRDLERHARDFAERRAFTYTVLSTGTGDVIGCVYVYPARGHEPEADGMRPSNPGYAPTAPRSILSSTTRSSRGWNATGHLISNTLPGPDQRPLPRARRTRLPASLRLQVNGQRIDPPSNAG